MQPIEGEVYETYGGQIIKIANQWPDSRFIVWQWHQWIHRNNGFSCDDFDTFYNTDGLLVHSERDLRYPNKYDLKCHLPNWTPPVKESVAIVPEQTKPWGRFF